jgi:hypothetical protein
MPFCRITGAASGDVRNFTGALAASGACSPAEKHSDLLNVAGQWCEEIDALDRQQLAHLLETDLGVALRHDRAHRYAVRHRGDARFQLIGDPHFCNRAAI